MVDDIQIRDFIAESFRQNFELLSLESNAPLAPDAREAALNQVLLYWKKLKNIAETVTDTEVRLNLPNQVTPKGRKFAIEGVVDIVRDEGMTVMYDIKTHDIDYVHSNPESYTMQLNVYAHIWTLLRGQPLDDAVIIATQYPERIKAALVSQDKERLEHELMMWHPLFRVPYDAEHVEGTISSFGEVIDRIEDSEFAPPDQEKLLSKMKGSNATFATNVCRNCDARFSCSAFRTYARNSGSAALREFKQYYDEPIDDLENDTWLSGMLEAPGVLGDLLE